MDCCDMPTWISAISDAITASVAILAVLVAIKQLKTSHEDQKITAAKELYRNYLQLAFENPRFSSPSYPKDNPSFPEIKNNPIEFEQYEFYVSNFLFAAEEILRIDRSDDWTKTIIAQMKYHALYLRDLGDFGEHYSEAVLDMIETACTKYESEDR